MIKGLVSILVPVYNVSQYLTDCFKSIDNQTYKNIEVIFINDGSTDNSLELLNKYSKAHSNVKVISQTNQGVSATRNALLSNANGEFIYYFDPDDIMHPQTIEYLVNLINEKNTDLVSGYSKFCKEKTNYDKIHWKSLKKVKAKHVSKDKLILFLTDEFFGSGCRTHSKIFRTELLKKLDNFPNILPTKFAVGEDFYLLTSYLQQCSSAYLVNFKFLYYRMRKGSILHAKKFDPKNLNLLDADEAFYKVPHSNIELEAMKAKKAFHAIGTLWFMKQGKYNNPEDIIRIYDILKENAKYLHKGKLHRFYYHLLPIMILYFKPYYNRAKKALIKKNEK